MRELSILLAEDNADDEMLTLWVLRRAGYPCVTVARDGQETLSLLLGERTCDGKPFIPDLLLLDLMMPRVTGINVLRRLRADERTRKLAVVVLTSSEDPAERSLCLELGAVAILSKPLTTETLLNALRNLPPDSLWVKPFSPPSARE